MSQKPPILEGCDVLPAMPSPVEPEPARKKRASKKAGKRRTAGRFEVLNAFVDVTLRELDATAAVVWLILYRDTKPNGLACTSQSDLARRAGLSISSIYRALRRLTRLGLLTLVRRGRVNSGASVYRVRAEIELGFRER